MSDTTDPRPRALAEQALRSSHRDHEMKDWYIQTLARALLTALDDFGSSQAALKASNLARHAAEAEVARFREALRGMVECVERHERWCGFNEDAPGDGIINEAPYKARDTLWVSSGSAPAEADEETPMLEPPYTQVVGRNAVVLLTPEQIDWLLRRTADVTIDQQLPCSIRDELYRAQHKLQAARVSGADTPTGEPE